MARGLGSGKHLPPLLHLAGQPPVSWFAFTHAIFAACAAAGIRDLPDLVPVKTSAFPRPAHRPVYSALDCGLAASLGYAVPDWRAALPPLVAQLTKKRIAA
jgi:dTDP-4-dehydrorhamnose reductase